MSGATNMTIGPEGLRVRQTDATRDVLTRAATVQKKKTAEGDNDADDDANEFANHAQENTVPFRLLRRACDALRASAGPSEGDGPYLQDITIGGGVHLTGPKPAPRDPKLDAILAKIRREKEDREYDEMTADVNKGGVADDGRLKMSSLTRDLGFGAHVFTVMFACALGGWFAGAAIARGSRDGDEHHHDQSSLIVKATLAGIGALGAMFVEAALFMLRDGRT
tara:strand:+ start:316 stop:984 length:669 start_codon:yes stop_codon:yes gene_type:complete